MINLRELVIPVMVGLFPGISIAEPSRTKEPSSQNEKLFQPKGKDEILQQNPAWCGPRILFFFAWYFGKECSLEEVIYRCKTDENGYTNLLNLVEAARWVGLDSTPIKCNADELFCFGVPAIICVKGPKSLQHNIIEGTLKPDLSPVFHFVGLISEKDGYYLICNPGITTETFLVSKEVIRREFTGHAVLLKEKENQRKVSGWLIILIVFTLTSGAVVVIKRIG